MGKYYAVRVGRKPGIYTSRQEYLRQMAGFPGQEGRAFDDRKSAEAWMAGTETNMNRYYAVTTGDRSWIVSGTKAYRTCITGLHGYEARRFDSADEAEEWIHRVSAGGRVERKYQSDTVRRKERSAAMRRAAEEAFQLKKKESDQIRRELLRLVKDDPGRILSVDLEMTDHYPTAEILQVSIVDGYGETVMDRYFKPERIREWSDTVAVHHITPDMVKDAPFFRMHRQEIGHLLSGASLLVGYGIRSDLDWLLFNRVRLPADLPCIDLQRAFQYAVRDDEKAPHSLALANCAAYYGFQGESQWHDSRADAAASIFCFYRLLEDERSLFRREFCRRRKG